MRYSLDIEHIVRSREVFYAVIAARFAPGKPQISCDGLYNDRPICDADGLYHSGIAIDCVCSTKKH